MSDPTHNVIEFGSQRIRFELFFEDRRQLRIGVHPDRRVVVRAPAGKSVNAVVERVRTRANWLARCSEFRRTDAAGAGRAHTAGR